MRPRRYIAALIRESGELSTWIELPDNTAEAVQDYLGERPQLTSDRTIQRVIVGEQVGAGAVLAVNVMTVKVYDVHVETRPVVTVTPA